jgi:mRNA interferase RelE/StbE
VNWTVVYLPEAQEDLDRLDNSQRNVVLKAIKKIQTNPLPSNEGGYGKPLGNMSGSQLAGFLKVKLRGAGLRIVYKLVRVQDSIVIVVIGARADSEVYSIAEQRKNKYSL